MLRRQKHALSQSTTPSACTLAKLGMENWPQNAPLRGLVNFSLTRFDGKIA